MLMLKNEMNYELCHLCGDRRIALRKTKADVTEERELTEPKALRGNAI